MLLKKNETNTIINSWRVDVINNIMIFILFYFSGVVQLDKGYFRG